MCECKDRTISVYERVSVCLYNLQHMSYSVPLTLTWKDPEFDRFKTNDSSLFTNCGFIVYEKCNMCQLCRNIYYIQEIYLHNIHITSFRLWNIPKKGEGA